MSRLRTILTLLKLGRYIKRSKAFDSFFKDSGFSKKDDELISPEALGGTAVLAAGVYLSVKKLNLDLQVEPFKDSDFKIVSPKFEGLEGITSNVARKTVSSESLPDQKYEDSVGGDVGGLVMPVDMSRGIVTSKYGYRKAPVKGASTFHKGIDIGSRIKGKTLEGEPVRSVADGVVILKTTSKTAGNYLQIKHNDVYTTGYMHMQKFAEGLQKGSLVKAGQVIGYVGHTGIGTGAHLDFRVWKNGVNIDPLKFLEEGMAVNKTEEEPVPQVVNSSMVSNSPASINLRKDNFVRNSQ